ncbi:MAG: aminotransferase class IV [Bacteroidetes bacterium]|nr:aminotransferase class IV [Bacteroidota bacterium]MBU1372076.1 aminotransferase class IV [Bacteroidota bacterium]MBU1483678.1 aminotransferase class IV [Bacteroidota bacterium]MBU1760695.1 aminotransferase class IV [Bacteroidota bacterium]MBU2046548.1 aminotransferase class IV [Bacteroidota bacterium]
MINYKSEKVIYRDGEFYSSKDLGIVAASQTLHYGFGAFEGIRSYQTANGINLFKAKEHFERLKDSCEQIHLPFEWNINQLVKDTYKLLSKNKLVNAYIRPIVIAEADMTMVNSNKSHIILMAWEWNSYYGGELLKTCFSSYESRNPKSSPISAKVTGNYLSSVLAVSEAKRKGFDEAILTDMHGYLTESSSANIFIENDGKLYTPKEENIIAGITRKTIIQLAKELDIEVIEKNLTPEDLKKTDAAFLCGTAVEIVGLQLIENHVFPLAFADSLGAILQRVYKNIVLDKLSFEVII